MEADKDSGESDLWEAVYAVETLPPASGADAPVDEAAGGAGAAHGVGGGVRRKLVGHSSDRRKDIAGGRANVGQAHQHEAATSRTTRAPLAIVLGWMGSQPRHVDKYSAVWQKRGYAVLRAIAPVAHVMMPQKHARRRAEAAEQLLMRALRRHSPPHCVVHIFSNGGCMLWRHMAPLLSPTGPYAALNVRAVIFDSCPCPLDSMLTGARAVYYGTGMDKSRPFVAARAVAMPSLALFAIALLTGRPSAFAKWLRGWLRTLFQPTASRLRSLGIVAIVFAIAYWNTRRRVRIMNDAYWGDLVGSRVGVPELYIFSTSDSLVPASGVEKMIAARRAVGVDVRTLRLGDSQHVGHLRTDPDAYLAALDSLLHDD